MLQCNGNLQQLFYPNIVAFKNGIHIRSCTMNLSGELRHRHSAFVKNDFYHVPDMNLLFFHVLSLASGHKNGVEIKLA